MRNTRRPLLAVAAAVSVAALTVSCAGNADPGNGDDGTTRLVVAASTDASALDLLAGVHWGFFEEEGLDVDIKFVNDSTTLPQVVGRQYDIASMVPNRLISSVVAGLELKAISGARVEEPDFSSAGVIVPADSPIQTFTDLVGKQVGTPSVQGAMPDSLKLYFMRQGVDFDGVQLLQGASVALPDLLKEKRFDAIIALEPFLSALKAEGYRDVGNPYLANGDSVLATIYVASDGWIDGNADTIVRWNNALRKAHAAMLERQDDARNLLVDYVGMSPETVANLPISKLSADFSLSQLEYWIDLNRQLDKLDEPLTAADLVAPNVASK